MEMPPMSTPESWTRARLELLEYCHRVQAEHLVYSTAGNLSCRLQDDPSLFAVTPTSLAYDSLEPDDIVIANTHGEVIDGRHRPTSEFPMHTLVYARRPEVGAIVHTHSPAAMVMCVMGWTLPPILTGFVEASGGDVVTAPYSRPGTEEMANFTADALKDRGVCFLRHHGLLAIGSDLAHAFQAASVTEGAALVYLRARQFGVDVPVLPDSEVEWIREDWLAQWKQPAAAGAGA
jgi:L-fuculose-phosphate aldolase